VGATLDDLSLPQQVGQLFVSGVDADHPTTGQLDSVTDHHLGGVVLTGGSSAGVRATARVSGGSSPSAHAAAMKPAAAAPTPRKRRREKKRGVRGSMSLHDNQRACSIAGLQVQVSARKTGICRIPDGQRAERQRAEPRKIA
jgi:hypothetical protein